MFKNYFKIALRTLWKNKGYALINILGLAIGISGATLLLTFVNDERRFDAFHDKSDRMVRPIAIQKNLEEPRYFASNPFIMASTMVDELPEVEQATSLTRRGGQINVVVNDVRFSERGYFYVDSLFFEVFDFDFLYGNSTNALETPFSAVVTENEAIKFFGKVDVIGEIIEAPGIGNFTVSAVLKNLPSNSHLQFDILVNPIFNDQGWQSQAASWTAFQAAGYLTLASGVDLTAFSKKAEDFINSKLPPNFAEIVDFEFQSIRDIHFESAHIEGDLTNNKGDKSYSVIFLSIAVFLILIAAVNYMNLATSKAVFRAREIGIRKVVGAVRKQLISQFLLESVLITFIALLISVGITDLAMPFFNDLTGKQFDFSWSTLPNYAGLLVGTTLLIGLLSGIYPAMFMTRFKPVDVLKGERVSGGSFNLRRALVVFQFVLSIVLIISTLVVSDQMGYIKNKNLGFNEENLIVIDINNGRVRPVFKTMRNELSQIPGVEQVSVTSRVPGEWKTINEVKVDLASEQGTVTDSAFVFYMSFDENALTTFDLQLQAGEYFSGNDVSDSTKILLNEAAVKSFGLEDPVGQTLRIEGQRGWTSYAIIGVLEDFNFQSLHAQIEPIIIGAWNNPNSIIDYFTLRVSGNTNDILEAASLVHEKFDNRTAMEYHFLDSQLELFYEAEQQASIIFIAGAGLSIFVACLGLFGLASFTVQKRIKELGIRKVLGASEWKLFYLLSSSFVKQILLAFVIASPFAYFIMRNWLNNFQYRVEIGIGAFLIAAVSSLLVALITVSYRSISAAHSNPVNSLRSE